MCEPLRSLRTCIEGIMAYKAVYTNKQYRRNPSFAMPNVYTRTYSNHRVAAVCTTIAALVPLVYTYFFQRTYPSGKTKTTSPAHLYNIPGIVSCLSVRLTLIILMSAAEKNPTLRVFRAAVICCHTTGDGGRVPPWVTWVRGTTVEDQRCVIGT